MEKILLRNFLIDKKFSFIEANFENKIGEIDLIMSRDKTLIFVEVKLKVGDKYGIPEDMITPFKLHQVRRVAESYLTMNPDKKYLYQQYRIDAVCIVMNEIMKVERISHYENL